MCTAISYKSNSHYFGRNLDLEYSYYESVTITPRNFEFKYRNGYSMKTHYAMIGMAYVNNNYPLYYDATNEKGLSMAGLNYPGNAFYLNEREGVYNIAPFEIIPWILGRCKNVSDAIEVLKHTNLIKKRYNKELPVTPLHFMISDKERSVVLEPGAGGIRLYDNPIGVLTNNPPFKYQLYGLNNYMHLSRKEPINTFSKSIPLEVYSRGMGALGLPGDLSSPSRFVRAAFVKENLLEEETEDENVSQFFHLLSSVEQPKGCVQVGKEEYEYTIYSSCCNTDEGVYYYRTYGNSQITAVDMHLEDLEGDELISYPLILQQQICYQNNL